MEKKRTGRPSPDRGPGQAHSGKTDPGRGKRVNSRGARIASAKNRRVQIVQPGGRKLFDKKRKEVFLEWFAATCNIKYAAARADISYQTVFKHRMADEAFAEMWDRCLAQGYARVEAQSVETQVSAEQYRIDGDWEAPELQEMDADYRLALIREHKKSLGAGASPFGAARKQGRRPRTASNEEVRAALVKRLVVFGVRVAAPSRDAQGVGGPSRRVFDRLSRSSG